MPVAVKRPGIRVDGDVAYKEFSKRLRKLKAKRPKKDRYRTKGIKLFGYRQYLHMQTYKRKSDAIKHKERIKSSGGYSRVVSMNNRYQVWEAL